MLTKLTAEDLEELSRSAETAAEPLAVAAELIAAVDQDRLADATADATYALFCAAEIVEAEGDPERALALAERAVQLGVADSDDKLLAQATHARLLHFAGREADGLAELATLRPTLLTHSTSASLLSDVLVDIGESELALEWLTEAAEATKGAATADEALPADVELFYEVARNRHDIREELGLPHDELDELADELTALIDEEEAEGGVLFWPQAEFDEALRRWPDMAGYLGPDWDEHRAIVERVLTELAASSAAPPLILTATADGLAAVMGDRDPKDPQVHLDYTDSLEGPDIEWPPPRNEACWCGSGLKYKKCCLPRGRL